MTIFSYSEYSLGIACKDSFKFFKNICQNLCFLKVSGLSKRNSTGYSKMFFTTKK